MQEEVPKVFKERYAGLLDEPEAFLSCLDTFMPRSFRVNTLKAQRTYIKERFDGYGIPLRQAPWYQDAFISDEFDVGSTFEHFTGQIYVQELVSMLPPLLVEEELAKARTVLDGCAAPGSKTTQLAAMMKNQGLIVANDISYSRIKALKFNLEKAGAINTIITNRDLRAFPKSEYDVILLDAPCSSEGTIRKNYSVFKLWSEKHIHSLARMQKQLIVKAFDLLRPGGVMVYSTCTFAPEENEAVLDHLLDERPALLQTIAVKGMRMSPPVDEWKGAFFHDEVRKAMRIWPHHNDTGGFFLAKVMK